MIINYFGKQFFRLSLGDLFIAINPISKDSKHKAMASRFGADISVSSVNHSDYNGVETVTYGEKEPFQIKGPGDYETKGIFIRGFETKTEIDKKLYINTIYSFSLDGMSVCFLGSLSGDIKSDIKEAIGSPDILFIPIGGNGILNFKEAYKIALSLEPKIIIPMDYGDDKEKDSLKNFLKETGDSVATVDKLTLKKKDLEGKEGEVVVLESQ